MPGPTTRTFHTGQAVYWGSTGGNLALLPWTYEGGGTTFIPGLCTSPEVTFPIAGPYPSVTFASEGSVTIPGAAFTPNVDVYLDVNGMPTQGTYFGQAAIARYTPLIGVAGTATEVLLNIKAGFSRSAATGLSPMVATDEFPYPHGPLPLELLLLKQGLGLGAVAGTVPIQNGDLVVTATSNTSLTFKLQGSDGVIRTGTLALS